MPILSKRAKIKQAAVSSSGIPVGTIVAYYGATAPSGWLLCDGSSTSGHPQLVTLVGATTPDLRGYFIRGLDTRTSGYKDPYYTENSNTARSLGKIQTDAFQGHSHSGKSSNSGQTFNYSNGYTALLYSNNNVGEAVTSTYGNIRVSTETRPMNISLNYIIRAD